MKKILIAVAAAAATLALSITANAAGIKHGSLMLEGVWVRATATGAPTSAGYVTIHNTGSEDDRLVSASTDVAKKTEIHTMTMDGGVMRMRPLTDGVVIPAGAKVALKPGGEHIMIMGLKNGIESGSDVTITLVFEKAGAIDVTFPASMKMKKDEGHNHGHQMKKGSN
jgi:copper(I)-binding protein